MPRRTLIATALAVSLLSAAPLYAGDAEAGAVKAVEKLGGSVVRDDTDPARPVVAVSFVAVPVTDRELKCLAALKGLKTLDLALCLGVTDAGVKELAALKVVQELNLSYTGATDAGVKQLAALKGLKKLNLRGAKTTGDGVSALQKALPDCKIDRCRPAAPPPPPACPRRNPAAPAEPTLE